MLQEYRGGTEEINDVTWMEVRLQLQLWQPLFMASWVGYYLCSRLDAGEYPSVQTQTHSRAGERLRSVLARGQYE